MISGLKDLFMIITCASPYPKDTEPLSTEHSGDPNTGNVSCWNGQPLSKFDWLCIQMVGDILVFAIGIHTKIVKILDGI